MADLIERLRAATMRFDWGDLPDDAAIPAVPLLREAATALSQEREAREKAEAQIAYWQGRSSEAIGRAMQREALAFADEQSSKVEALLEPHIKWEPGTIRICPMRDGPYPHGMSCKFVGDGYMGWPCKDGWSSPRDAPASNTEGKPKP